MFQKATRKRVFLKLGMTGPTGSGKTMSSLKLARGLVGPDGKIAFIDTENGSASLYDYVTPFDVLEIEPPFTDDKFIKAIHGAVAGGYQIVIIDSGSHFWEGILEFKSKIDARGGNSYTNWDIAGAKYKGVLNAVLQSRIHLIMCLRAKMDYILETNEKGKQVPRKVGLAPQMRNDAEYEFTVVFDLDHSHQASTSKDRTNLFDGKIFQITEATGGQIAVWRDSATVEVGDKIPFPQSVGKTEHVLPVAPASADPLGAEPEPTWKDTIVHVGQLAKGKRLGDVDKAQIEKLYVNWCPTIQNETSATEQDVALLQAISAAVIELGIA